MNYLETIKNITKDKNRKTENLIFLVILLVIFLISIKYIFDGNSNEKKSSNSNSTSSNSSINSSSSTIDTSKNFSSTTELENKLSNILSQISGISEVSVVLTYSKDTTTIPIYNTKEQEKSGETTTEKSVAYNEEDGNKTAIVQSVELPKVEGAIVVAKGADTVEMKSKISTAISNLTSVPTYKIQVFEK
jgi:stage III sporulation protein AG